MNKNIKIFNTLNKKKESLSSLHRKNLRIFVCGPTVYDDSHIGHARTYIFFDFLVKYLRKSGYKAFYVQNITNIDDKIISKAKKLKQNPLKLAEKFTKKYIKDMGKIGVDAVDVYAPASKFIKQIINQISSLIKKGYAYKIDNDGYYFNISKFKDYGKLSGRTIKQAEDATSRIDESLKKKNKGDFCLWKFPKNNNINNANSRVNKARLGRKFTILEGEPLWNTSLGWGRPGWHIEDTAISEYYFGQQYEIHGGGVDLKFPHHEAEIAQQEAASGKKPFVKIWIHTGTLTINGKKMSKSLRNFITIDSFLKKHSSGLLRFILLNSNYKAPLNYTKQLVKQSIKTIENTFAFIDKINFVLENKNKISKKAIKTFSIKRYINNFNSALEDDINTQKAFSEIFSLINEANNILYEIKPKSLQSIKKFIIDCYSLFGITIQTSKIPRKIKDIAKTREKYRRNKQFVQSDGLRKKINSLGYEIEDTPIGTFIRQKSYRI